ncbi:MAG: fused MFS/spermidine synthase [Myxococcales bacterium]|nr:fused MFS/spermidine synthase [Myxococcales bacterium]
MFARLLIAALFIASGALGVVDEVLWARLLGLHLGHAATAHATVVSTFLLGLGIGYAWLGRSSDGLQRPLLRYAWLEISLGLWAVAFPYALSALVRVAPMDAPLGRALLAGALLLPPTIAMGGTLPALVRLLGQGPAAGGRALATLYGLNSLGAVVGGLVGGFYMLEQWGTERSLVTAGLGSVAVGLWAWWLDVTWAKQARAGGATTDGPTTRDATRSPSNPRPTGSPSPSAEPVVDRWPIWLIASVTGLASLLMQTLWFRVFGVVLGSSAHVFALVITAFIAGITGGAALARWLLRQGVAKVTWLAWLAVIGSALLLAISPLHERLPWWLAKLRFALQPESFSSWQAAKLGLIATIIFIPGVAMGAILPLCGRLAMGPRRVAGAAAGVFAFNTAGSVVGAAVGGTVVVPWLGLHGTLTAAVLLLLLAAIVAELWPLLAPSNVASGRPNRALNIAPGSRFRLIVIALLCAVALLNTQPWDVRLLSAGAFRRKPTEVPTWERWQAHLQREQVVFSADGPDATVAVLAHRGAHVLKVNGKPDASSRGDMLTQVASAWIPAVFAKETKKILVIGLGSGVTAGAAARLGGRVDVVEISPAVARAAAHFQPWNDDALSKINLTIDDARAHLDRTTDKWDIIISEPSNPWVAGNGALFTREFFQLARAHLRPGGVMAQWFHAYEMNDELLRLVLRTVVDSFPQVSLWTLFPGDLLMIATENPQRIDERTAMRRLRSGKASLDAVELRDLPTLLSLQALSPPALRAAVADGGEIHVDDRPLLELRAPRALFHGRRARVVKERDERAHSTHSGKQSQTLSQLPLPTLRSLARLHVRFPSAPAVYRHRLMAELARRETDVQHLLALVFTYGREGPAADAQVAVQRLLARTPNRAKAHFAAALVAQRLGHDARPHLHRCIALGDEPKRRCLPALRHHDVPKGIGEVR